MVYDPNGGNEEGEGDEQVYTVIGYDSADAVGVSGEGEELDSGYDLNDAKHMAVDYSDDYGYVVVFDQNGNVMFQLHGRG